MINLSNKFFLRPSTINDFDEIFKLRKNKKLWKYTFNSNFNYSYKIQKRYYKKKINFKKNICFSIISVNRNFIGFIQLTNVNKNIGEFHIVLNEKYWNKKIGYYSTKIFLHIIKIYGIANKIFLMVHKKNISAIKLYKNIGFKTKKLDKNNSHNLFMEIKLKKY
jgi:RimJ/RimL family protein N-acetyltransferase